MRLIDLHVDWPLQHAGESTALAAEHYPGITGRLGQAEAYLQSVQAAVIACYRSAADWASQADPWAALAVLMARVEAEFSGRLLIGPHDLARWLDDSEGLCWGVLGIEGFDALVRTAADLDRLPALFDRGVRLFQPVYGPTSALAGSSAPGDDRGFTDLGRGFLDVLLAIVPTGIGPRPMLDLAHLNPASAADVLDWFEVEPGRADRLIPVYSHGAPHHPGFTSGRALDPSNLRRLRALGGFVGVGISPPFFQDPDQIREAVEEVAAVPFRGREGIEGIAIGTDFLGVAETLPGLRNAPDLIAWFQSSFDRPTASALLRDNALGLFRRIAGSW